MTEDISIKKAEESLLFYTVRPDVVMTQGEGMYLTDEKGKKYLDFLAGWAVNSLGHCPSVVQDVLTQQAATLINASPAFYNQPMLDFAQDLTDKSCFDRVFFSSTGAEANEAAIKLARKYGAKSKKGAYEIITTSRAFHGRTLATMSATGKPQWKDLFEPKAKGFIQVPFNDSEAIKDVVSENVCAIMIEPIQGEGGVYPADESYMLALRKLCDEHNMLLIFDEVQTGFGRTGTLFCYEQYGIEPDVMTLGKGIGSGFPLSAMLCKERLNIFEPGDQGGTYTGQPLGMAVGHAVLKEICDKNLVGHAYAQGEKIKEALIKRKDAFGISDVRGKGLLIGFDFKDERAKDFAEYCFDHGLIVNMSGPKTIRLVPALIIEDDHIKEAFQIIDGFIKS